MRISDWSSDVCSSDLSRAPAIPRSRWGASASDSGAGRFAQALDQRRLLLEADARRIGQRDAPAFHPGVVGEADEGREDLRIGLVDAELKAGGDVQRELMTAMRHQVADGEANGRATVGTTGTNSQQVCRLVLRINK